MLRLAPVLVLGLAALGAINPLYSWLYIVAAAPFELWLLRRMRAAGSGAPAAGEPPYQFSEEEAQFIGRFRFYFAFPAIARDAASVFAALGLTALVLAPWLTFRGAYPQAVLIGANLLAVARFTRRLAPVMALRIAASKGDRAALRLLELHDPLWAKIRATNAAGGEASGPGL